MAESDKSSEIIVCSQTPVHQLIIPCIVAVSRGLKQRADVNGAAVQAFDMGNPQVQFPETAFGLCLNILFRRAGHTQRVHVIKDGLFIPGFIIMCHACPPPAARAMRINQFKL